MRFTARWIGSAQDEACLEKERGDEGRQDWAPGDESAAAGDRGS
jgi:hypothetical protein